MSDGDDRRPGRSGPDDSVPEPSAGDGAAEGPVPAPANGWIRGERLLRRVPLLPAALGAMLGIALADGRAWLWLGASLALPLLAAVVALARRRAALAAVLLACGLAVGGGAALHWLRLEQIRAFPFAGVMEQGRSVEISGRGWIAARPQFTGRSVFGTLHLDSVTIGGREVPCDHRVPVWIQRHESRPAYGEVYEFTGVLSPLGRASAPGGFDPASYHFRDSGALGRLEVREGDRWHPLEGARAGSRLVALAQRWRDRMEGRLLEGLSPAQEPYARLVAAMALGARESSPEELEEAFRLSGTMHLFAVSGLHVGVVAALVLGVFALARLPARTAAAIAIPLVLFYALLTGLRPSAVRAAAMLAVVLAALVARERPRLLNSLAFAALLLLAADTQQLFLPGFQLSFAVVLFLIVFTAPAQRAIAMPWLSDPFLPRSLRSRMRRAKDRTVQGLAAALAVSLVSWLGSLGLLAWHFQSVAPVGILANVVMVPVASLLVSLAMASLLAFGLSLGIAGTVLNQANIHLAMALTWMAHGFGTLPGAHLHTGGGALPPPAPSAVTLDLLGEGGDGAALLSLPAGGRGSRSYWMIDTGGDRTFDRQVLPLLRNRAVNRLDALVLTHWDVGHLGAAPRVVTQLRPALVFESPAPNRSPAGRDLEAVLSSKPGIRRMALSAGNRVVAGEGVVLETLWPPADFPGRLADDGALVLRLSYAGWSVLLSSDAGFATERALLESGGVLSAHVWVRGQHVQEPGGSPEFVAAVSPRAVVSSSAEYPAHERISEALRALLEERGVPLYALGETGVVTLELEPGRAVLSNHGEARRVLRLEQGPGREVEVVAEP